LVSSLNLFDLGWFTFFMFILIVVVLADFGLENPPTDLAYNAKRITHN